MNQRKGKRVARSPCRRARRRAGEKERKGTEFKSENQTLTLKRKPTWALTHRRRHRHRADRRPRRRSRTARGTEPRSALHLARAVTATGHHHAAPRRRRAQPRASTHAGERALDGATFLLPRPLRTAAAAGLSELRCAMREKGRERMNLGFLEGCGRGEFLSGRKARRTVDRRSTATSASGHIQPRRDRARG